MSRSPIREASGDDFAALLHIERENMLETVERLNPEPWSDESCLRHLRACLERQNLWVFMDGSEIIGHYGCSPMKKSVGSLDSIHLDSIQVVRDRQRQGVGRLLLEHFLHQACQQGFQHAVLHVHLGNPAIHLYTRFGFGEVERSSSHIRMELGLVSTSGTASPAPLGRPAAGESRCSPAVQ